MTFVSSRQVNGENRPGAAGTQELTFQATDTGKSTLKLEYARSFEKRRAARRRPRAFPVTVG